uniref:VHL domain-containing protein n=1 Tax=Onchocerca volvulus TaxID=6282 RepID=A0A8R1XUB6_ONCVO
MSLNESRINSFILEEIFAPRYKSIRSVEEVNIRFINNSRDTVDLCWVDFQGNLVRYLKLGSREVVKLTSFTGHCWIARFIRNGAAAQFLPGCTEVFVITRPYPHTAVVFIIQKVPTLFEAAVEHIGELFHENQYALHRLPVPELVKFDIYFYIRRKQIYQTALFVLPFQRNFLRRNRNNVARLREPLEVDEQLAEIFANGQIDLCLQTVSDLSVECSDFEINEIFLTYLKKEFVVMGFSTVYNYAKKWIGFLLQNTSVGIRNHCLLLKQIICCTNLLQNKQLLLLLHEILPQIYHHLCCMKQYSVALIIAEIIFYAIALPTTYSDDYDREALWNVWNKLLLSKECVKSAHFNLCTVLVMSSLDLDCAEHMQSLENSFNDLEENDDFSFNLRKQFLVLLEANLGIFLSRCQPTQSKLLLNILITFHLENNDLHLLMQSIFRYSGLADTCSYKILQPFFRCLLLNLSLFIDENSQQKGNIGIWIKKIVVEILSMSNKSYEDELKSWKMIMSEFIIAPHHMLLSDNKRFCQIIQLICGKKVPLKTLPISLRVTLFCVLISLIPYISSEMFEIAVESILSIIRLDAKLFRSLINSCKEKILKKYIKILLRSGCSNNYSKNAQILVKEFLLNSCNHGTLALKCDVILKAALQRALVEEQYYFLKPLCDTFSEIHYEINTEENSILRIRAEEILQHVYGLVSPLDYRNAMKMVFFELSLSMLPVVEILQKSDKTATEKEIKNIAKHVKIADELCKTLCKHPERLIEFGIISEQLSQLLRTSILWMVRRGKLERIVSWKYVRYFELYDDTTVNDIISVASVDMLKSLLYSSWHDLHASKKFTLYFALAKHQNEDKRKLLSTVLKDILEVTVDIAAGADYLIVIDFLRHILPIVTGNAYERDFTSFALALLAANYESLSSDFIALRSAVSLLLDCLRFGAHSVINDQCSFYMSLFVYVGRAVQKYVNNASEVNPQLIRHLSYGLAKVAHEMVKHERSFSRVAPFIISECLEDTKYLSLALFRIFSICDRHSIALLTTNLPPLQKTRFANLSLQFKKIKMVV